MAITLTVDQVRRMAVKRAQREGSTLFTDYDGAPAASTSNEIITDINLSCEQHLANLRMLRPSFGIKATNLQVTPSAASVALPNDYDRLKTIRLILDNTRIPLRRLTEADQTTSAQENWRAFLPRYSQRVSISNTQHIVFDPPTDTTRSVTIEYQFAWTTHTTTQPIYLPYIDWVILDVALRLIAKERLDPNHLLAERQRVEQKIEVWHTNDDDAGPRGIADHRSGSGGEESPWGYW